MTIAPTSLDELQRAVEESAPAPLILTGAGTKRAKLPEAGAVRLDLRRLRGVVAYDPAECVVTARAGTPVAEIESALSAHGQYLPCDPPLAETGATLGGLVASGWSGSCRYRYGGIRDFVIGARFVDGHGVAVASGGQVVKNAAGFLVHHALVGSAGRLGAIAELSLKVFPRPEARRTLLAQAPSLPEAVAAHERLRSAPLDLDALDLDASSHQVVVRVGGAGEALPPRLERIRHTLGLPVELAVDADDARIWHDVSECYWAAAANVIKLPAAPSRLPAMLQTLTPFGRCRAAAGGAVVFLATDAPLDDLDASVTAASWRGVVVRGPAHGRRLGAGAPNAFDRRVHAAVDPDGRFQ